MDFSSFAHIVAGSFQDFMKDSSVFVADVDADALWEKYLASFPDGSNPIFKKRTEHDCSCCRQFVRRAGAVVVIKNGMVHTVWDAAGRHADGPYDVVARSLAVMVRSAGIRDIFRVGTKEVEFGAQRTRSLDESGHALSWNHFYTKEIPRVFRSATPDADRGSYRTKVQVFERGLNELSPEAVDTVLSLIESNAIYRGEEKKRLVLEFQKVQRAYLALGPKPSANGEDMVGDPGPWEAKSVERTLFAWTNAGSPTAHFRSDVIGTLVQDLSEGHSLEAAVRSFEAKVAPTNYRRTTALITPGMVKKAMATIEELGLESALERRLAVIEDISVNDVKWVNGTVRSQMKGGLHDVLMKHLESTAAVPPLADRAEDISLDDFMMKVLPGTQELELFFTGAHIGNLMVLTAPVHPEPKQLFQWNNDFAWSYGGNVTDSIKERVKKAGGKVEGAALRVSLSWFNYDDLDLHVHEPVRRGVLGMVEHINFRNKHGWTGGTLDVDMNAGRGTTREPVENVVWEKRPPDGPYRIVVNNYSHRETSNPGFVIEVECGGKLTHYSYNKQVRNQQDVLVVTLHMKNGAIERVEAGESGITTSNISQDKWGLQTERYAKVSTVMLSPNYWGENAYGNKHTFFVLEGCKSDEDMRGFYNEFLHPRLETHRKVFEVIGDKTKCSPTEGHLAGLGFSSTKPDTFLVRAHQGKKQRIFNIYVGV